jgi:alpha-beta hydrolase superfamily lysophospholipase
MQSFSLTASDGQPVACYRWLVDAPRANIHIAHGMGEHAQRYDDVARVLNHAGFNVFANDHRGHGETGRSNLGYMGGDGWNRVLADAYELNRMIAGDHAGVPLILLGHSMGSMMAQLYITRYGASIDALVLSGSPGFKARLGGMISSTIARIERWRLGPDKHSELMQNLLFSSSNKAFNGPDASGFEWLSRDPAEVRKYVDDEACGFVLTTGSLLDLFEGSRMNQQADCLAKIPKTLPMYVFSGSEDPVHGAQQDIHRMLQAFYDQDLADIEVKWYPGGRHEMFNETNRGEVLADLIAWIERHTN